MAGKKKFIVLATVNAPGSPSTYKLKARADLTPKTLQNARDAGVVIATSDQVSDATLLQRNFPTAQEATTAAEGAGLIVITPSALSLRARQKAQPAPAGTAKSATAGGRSRQSKV